MVIHSRPGKQSLFPAAEPFAEVYAALRILPLDGSKTSLFGRKTMWHSSQNSEITMENKETKLEKYFWNVFNCSKPETVIIPFVPDSQH